jgi:hypothetical protein
MCHTGLLTASRIRTELQFYPDPARCQAVNKPVWHIPLLCLQWKTPDDGQRNCPKHVQFYCKNKFEKLVQLVGFIIRILLSVRLFKITHSDVSFPLNTYINLLTTSVLSLANLGHFYFPFLPVSFCTSYRYYSRDEVWLLRSLWLDVSNCDCYEEEF